MSHTVSYYESQCCVWETQRTHEIKGREEIDVVCNYATTFPVYKLGIRVALPNFGLIEIRQTGRSGEERKEKMIRTRLRKLRGCERSQWIDAVFMGNGMMFWVSAPSQWLLSACWVKAVKTDPYKHTSSWILQKTFHHNIHEIIWLLFESYTLMWVN